MEYSPPLHEAIQSSDIESVRRAIQNGSDVNELWKGVPPLHTAAANPHNLHIVQLLIANGADVLAKIGQNKSYTALYWACSYRGDNYDIVKLLLDSGVDCDARSLPSDARPPDMLLCVALANSTNPEVIKLLLNYGADVRAVTDSGESTLHYAAINRLPDMVEIILNQGIDIQCSSSGCTALHYAVSHQNPEVCEVLLRRGANVNARASSDYTPLTVAVDGDCQRTIKVLLKYGANVYDEYAGMSVLEIAHEVNKSENVKILIQKMAEMEILSLSIYKDDWRLIESSEEYRSHYDEYREVCLRELQSMKDTKFYEHVSVYKIFVGSKKELRGYARNEDLVSALDARVYENKFPIYFTFFNERFHAEVDEQKSRKIAASTLSLALSKVNDSSHLIYQKIISYLRNEDLTFLNADLD